MIKEYRALAVFVAVAEAGSLSEAGRALNLSTSVVSHHIAKLEEKVGAALFFRTSRRLTLTSEGQSILDAAKRMVQAGDEAFDTLTAYTDEPSGSLRISAPAFDVCPPLRSAIWDFARTYPQVSLSMQFNDAIVDLIDGGFDLAIRLGAVKDAKLRSQRIATFEHVLVASPRLLERLPPIRTVKDLRDCKFVGVTALPASIAFTKAEEQATLTPTRFSLQVDSVLAAKSAVVEGLGIQRLPTTEIEQELQQGDLVKILPDWKQPKLAIQVVWLDTGTRKQLSRRFVEHITQS